MTAGVGRMWLLLVAGAALIIGYEIWAAVTNNTTISQMVWTLNPSAAFFIGFGAGLLAGHFFLPRRIHEQDV